MFGFEKLEIYQRGKQFHLDCKRLMKSHHTDRDTERQFHRASLSIPLNLAEGTGRFTHPDKRKFYIIARSSLYECASLLDILHEDGIIKKDTFNQFYKEAEELSKMILSMIKYLEKK